MRSEHPKTCRSVLKGLLLSLAAFAAGCGPDELRGLRPVCEFVRAFDEGRSYRSLTAIDVGSERHQSRLVRGWSLPESDAGGTSFVWATALEAAVELEITRPAAANLEFRCLPYSVEGQPDQSVAVAVNETEIGDVVLRPGWSTHVLAIPQGALGIGTNTVRFRFDRTASPSDRGSSDRRKLAAAFDFIGLGDEQPAAAGIPPQDLPEVDHGRLSTPPGSAIVYTVSAPRDGVLETSADDAGGAVTGEVWLRAGGEPWRLLLSTAAEKRPSGPLRAPIGVEPGTLAQIAFTAHANTGDPSGAVSVGWLSPRLYGRQHDLDPVHSVVLVVVDTLRADHVGAYGSTVSTPNINRIAASGVRFSTVYSHIPITGPSHASLFSSMLPFEHGVLNNVQIFDPGVPTMAEVLGTWGRRTAGFVSLGVLQRSFRFDRGFESYHDGFERDWMKDASEVNAEVMEWLADASEAPFFAWIHYSDPHEPYTPPGVDYPEVELRLDGGALATVTANGRGHRVPLMVPPGAHSLRIEASATPPRHTVRFPLMEVEDDRLRLVRREGWKTKNRRFGDPAFDTRLPATVDVINPTSEPVGTALQLICKELLSIPEIRERYALEVEFVDRRIGELLDAFERKGMLDDTLLIFTSDHGEGFGEHNHVGHISQLYEQLVRVPLILSMPGRIAGPAVVDAPVGLIDVYPTVVELLGVPPPPGLRGRSLVPLIDGCALPERAVVAETHRPEAATDKQAVIFEGFKYIHSIGDREWEELYDLREDPGETNDLFTTRPDVVKRMREILERRLEGGGAVSVDAELTEKEKQQLRALGYIR